ncbi:hypothetical protein QJS10_CPB21g01738 [Acorus calamus]|uniref:DUF4283 domain-containing protein n=1 Tax=Acorus calamus TaxID=4465 RepID=A0AAV9C5M5_ACOCL|nr:hypothetical protein QJS10_CPB21g01738 [Acorus calamus]
MIPPIDHLFSSSPQGPVPSEALGPSAAPAMLPTSLITQEGAQALPVSFAQAVQQRSIVSYTLPEPSMSNGRRVVRLNPAAHLSCLREQDHSLVGKFAGRRPSVESIERNISRHWKTSQSVLVGFGTNGCLRFEFKCMGDLEMVLQAAPWSFAGNVLRLKRWEQTFDPSIAFPALVPVWIKIYNLSFDLFRQDLLMSIGKGIEKPLRIDAYTLARKRLSFARICVEINPLDPLIEEIDVITSVGLTTVKIEYEYIPEACSFCGIVGHPPHACPSCPTRKAPPLKFGPHLRPPDKGKGLLKTPSGRPSPHMAPTVRSNGSKDGDEPTKAPFPAEEDGVSAESPPANGARRDDGARQAAADRQDKADAPGSMALTHAPTRKPQIKHLVTISPFNQWPADYLCVLMIPLLETLQPHTTPHPLLGPLLSPPGRKSMLPHHPLGPTPLRGHPSILAHPSTLPPW